jgi:hypothetical protein
MPPPNAKIGRWFMLYKTMLGYIKLNWGMAFLGASLSICGAMRSHTNFSPQ